MSAQQFFRRVEHGLRDGEQSRMAVLHKLAVGSGVLGESTMYPVHGIIRFNGVKRYFIRANTQ